MRLGWGLAAVAVVALAVWQFPMLRISGRNLLGVLHGCMAVMLLVVAPIGGADAISREKREGTLGLLMLTSLTPGQVVWGKLAAHFVRTIYVTLIMFPLLLLPVLIGGVDFREFLSSAVILIFIAAVGFGSALIASSAVTGFGAVVALSIFGSVFLVWLVPTIVTNAVTLIFPGRNISDLPFAIRLLMGPYTILVPIHSRDVYGMLFASGWVVPAIELSLFVFSTGFLSCAARFASRKVAQHVHSSGETARQKAFRRRFLTPRFFKSAFRKQMSRRLDNNPLYWLEYRTAWARAVRWLMILVVVISFVALTMGNPDADDFMSGNTMLLGALALFVAFKSAGSFHDEKETGAFELLLVTPLTEKKLLCSRLLAVADYYKAALVLLAVLDAAFVYVLWGHSYDAPSGKVLILTSLTASLATSPICGLFFALRSKTFLAALLWTIGVAVAGPLGLWLSFYGLLDWLAQDIEFSLAILLRETLVNYWQVSVIGVLLIHLAVAVFCLRRTLKMLLNRQFA